MIALLLCLIAGLAAFVTGRRSLGAGCLVVIATGYAYGIVRANLLTPFSHFTFDAALMGLYASQFLLKPKDKAEKPANDALRLWLIVLMIWPVLLVFLPFQPLLVSLVGLRGNMYLFPVLLLGARLQKSDLRALAIGLAVLNGVSLVFGAAEYRLGIERFFPYSAVTAIIYASWDGAGSLRIPSTFATAHVYALTMVDTLPFLFGYWAQRAADRRRKLLLALGIASALFGVVLAATRVGMIAAGVVVLVAGSSSKLGTLKRWGLALAVGAVIFAAVHNERWQRYKELDKDTVTERIGGSVNRTFLEVLVEYPMGNGLGGGGTSIPYFLGSEVNRPIVVENEYSRILLEQGLVGLLLWVAFILWFVTNRSAFVRGEWQAGRRIAWWLTVFTLASSVIGTGLLTAIPTTFLLLLAMGWVSVRPVAALETHTAAPRRVSVIPAVATVQLR
jgi:hypothetical protein